MGYNYRRALPDFKFAVSVPFNANPAEIQSSFISTFYPAQNHTSTNLSEGNFLWMLFSTKRSPATDTVGKSQAGGKFGRGLPVPRVMENLRRPEMYTRCGHLNHKDTYT